MCIQGVLYAALPWRIQNRHTHIYIYVYVHASHMRIVWMSMSKPALVFMPAASAHINNPAYVPCIIHRFMGWSQCHLLYGMWWNELQNNPMSHTSYEYLVAHQALQTKYLVSTTVPRRGTKCFVPRSFQVPGTIKYYWTAAIAQLVTDYSQ